MELFCIITLTLLGAYAWFQVIYLKKQLKLYPGIINSILKITNETIEERNRSLVEKEKELQQAYRNLEEMKKIIIGLEGKEHKKVF